MLKIKAKWRKPSPINRKEQNKMTPKEIKQYCKDEAIKKYLLKHAKCAMTLHQKNSTEKFKALKTLLCYGEKFRFSRNDIIFTNNIKYVSDKDFYNIRYIQSSWVEYSPHVNRLFIYFSDDFELIQDIKYVGLKPVIII